MVRTGLRRDSSFTNSCRQHGLKFKFAIGRKPNIIGYPGHDFKSLPAFGRYVYNSILPQFLPERALQSVFVLPVYCASISKEIPTLFFNLYSSNRWAAPPVTALPESPCGNQDGPAEKRPKGNDGPMLRLSTYRCVFCWAEAVQLNVAIMQARNNDLLIWCLIGVH